jgi:hypothetical protein
LDGPSVSAATPCLKVRLAGLDDLPRLIEFSKAFHQASPWAEVDFNEYKMKKVLLEMIAEGDAVVIMHDKGFIGGAISTPFFSTSPIAQELFWWAEESGVELLEAFEAWAYHEGAEMVSMASTGLRAKALERLYRGRGYEAREATFVKRFDD